MKQKTVEDFDLLGGRLVDPLSGINKVGDLHIRKGKIYHSLPKEGELSKRFII